MRRITLSTKLFGIFGFAVFAIVVWQTIFAGRVFSDIQAWRESYSPRALQSMLENQSKTYRKAPVGSFSKITVENGGHVHIVKSDSYGVYYSSYDRAVTKIKENGGELRIVFKPTRKHEYARSMNTPIFVLTPVEQEICFRDNTSSSKVWGGARADINGFDGHLTKIAIDRTQLTLQTNLAYLDVDILDGRLDLGNVSQYGLWATHTHYAIRAEQSDFKISGAKNQGIKIDADLDGSTFVISMRDARISAINLRGSLAPNANKIQSGAELATITFTSGVVCDTLMVNLTTPNTPFINPITQIESKYQFVLSGGIKGRFFEEVVVKGYADIAVRK